MTNRTHCPASHLQAVAFEQEVEATFASSRRTKNKPARLSCRKWCPDCGAILTHNAELGSREHWRLPRGPQPGESESQS